MNKTKFGISVGLMGAALYFIALFGNYTAAVIACGYVLLAETDEWLKQAAIRAVGTMIFFSLLTGVIGLIPDAIGCLGSLAAMFDGSFYATALTSFISAVVGLIGIVEKIVFIMLGCKALKGSTITIPFIDQVINHHM